MVHTKTLPPVRRVHVDPSSIGRVEIGKERSAPPLRWGWVRLFFWLTVLSSGLTIWAICTPGVPDGVTVSWFCASVMAWGAWRSSLV